MLDTEVRRRIKQLKRRGLVSKGVPDEGFEGNAQSFRILTQLAVHRSEYRGLNLTRATLRAVLKYPWTYGAGPYAGYRKYGAYESERQILEWVCESTPEPTPSLEAQIMDRADDITYSVHDLVDFYEAGLIDPGRFTDLEQLNQYLTEWANELRQEPEHRKYARLAELIDKEREDLEALASFAHRIMGRSSYQDGLEPRATLRYAMSGAIGEFFRALKLHDENGEIALIMEEDAKVRMKFLQRIVWTEVIASDRLSTQQQGQREVIRRLFNVYLRAIQAGDSDMLPPVFREVATNLAKHQPVNIGYLQLRLAADVVANQTDQEALTMYRRLVGITPGSIFQAVPT